MSPQDNKKTATPAAPKKPSLKKAAAAIPPHVPVVNSSSDDFILNESEGRVFFQIKGNPIPHQQRRLSPHGRYFNPIAKEQREVLKKLKARLRNNLLSGPLSVYYTFSFQGPNSDRKVYLTRGAKLTQHTVSDVNYPSCKPFPDIDNLLKFINDAMKQAVIGDDVQIVRIMASKEYSDRGPRTSINVSTLKPPVVVIDE